MNTATATVLEYTGERMVPEATDQKTFWEHICRYRFATQFVAGKRVLDIACGEGYGTAALQKAGASSVIGIDVAEEAVAHARIKYGVDARIGDAQNIPLPDNSLDVVVSFETLEHVPDPYKFAAECQRILVPGGLFIVSTPNRDIYAQRIENPFHCAEMNEPEFLALLGKFCAEWKLYSQSISTASRWSSRSFSAQQGPWQRLANMKALRVLIKTVFMPQLFSRTTEKLQSRPLDAIFAKERPFAAFANPYALWERNPATQEKPEYFLAAATMKG